jgi:hypothetical protein
MFSPMTYSYVVDDEYDTRKLNEKQNQDIILFHYLSPTITTTNESTTKESGKLVISHIDFIIKISNIGTST